MQADCYYLITIQFLGFRYSGWQHQPDRKTVEGMLLKTLKFILPDRQLKILGSGRTDAKVSALEAAFELFLQGDPLTDLESFKTKYNNNLPPDIKIININKVNKKFNIIQDCIQKEYVYLFSHGAKNHPYSAPFITGIQDDLDIELMKEGAGLFVGTHNFSAYTTRDTKSKQLIRTVNSCAIVPNNFLQASFFPATSFALVINAEGFLRYQVRMIMAALFKLGRHELELADIKASLAENTERVLSAVAPASGLMLRSLAFQGEL